MSHRETYAQEKRVEFRDTLVHVYESMRAAGVRPDDEAMVLARGLDFCLAPVEVRTESRPSIDGPAPSTSIVPAASAADDDGLAVIATRLGLDRETVADVYAITDGEPEVIVGSNRLPTQTAAATKMLAGLVVGARQAMGVEEWTSFDHIRDACEQYGRLDRSNFAATMKELTSVFGFRSPSARKREVKLLRPGWEHVAELVQNLGEGA